jgi:streptogramin lyase
VMYVSDAASKYYPLGTGCGTSLRAISVGPDGTVWCGTESGLCALRNGEWERHGITGSEIPVRFASPIHADSRGDVWVGSTARYHEGEWIEMDAPAQGATVDIAEAPDGTMWFACDNNVLSYDGSTWKSYETLYYVMQSIAVDRQGRVWVGGQSLIAMLDGETWVNFLPEQ